MEASFSRCTVHTNVKWWILIGYTSAIKARGFLHVTGAIYCKNSDMIIILSTILQSLNPTD